MESELEQLFRERDTAHEEVERLWDEQRSYRQGPDRPEWTGAARRAWFTELRKRQNELGAAERELLKHI